MFNSQSLVVTCDESVVLLNSWKANVLDLKACRFKKGDLMHMLNNQN